MKSIKCSKDSELLREDINNLSNLCTSYKIILNIAECHHTRFSRNKLDSLYKYFIIDGQELRKVLVDEIRDLGVLVDRNLKFDSHIKETVNKGFKMLGFVLRKAMNFKKPSSKINFF